MKKMMLATAVVATVTLGAWKDQPGDDVVTSGVELVGGAPSGVAPPGAALKGAPANMMRGAVELESVGSLTFSPDGTLFLGDTYGAAIYAVDLEEERASTSEDVQVEGLGGRIASLLGASRETVRINDIAVSPVSRNVFVTVTRADRTDGSGIKNRPRPGGTAHVIRVDGEGRLEEVMLDQVLYQKADIRDVHEQTTDRNGNDRRAWNILEMSFVDGTLYVSGMSNEEWTSKLRRLPYPFESGGESNALRIFHTAHGRYETGAPARVFVPYTDGDETRIFAGFSCTPLVDFSVAEMEENERDEGKTIAELGAGNHVLDMIEVGYEGETYFLLANHLHPFMRLALSDFGGADALTRPTGRAGIDRTPLGSMKGVTRIASDRDERVVFLQEDGDQLNLGTISVEALVD
jgi:hypothetical protein